MGINFIHIVISGILEKIVIPCRKKEKVINGLNELVLPTGMPFIIGDSNCHGSLRMSLFCHTASCGTVTLMVLGQFLIWSANIRKLAKDHKGYGSTAKTRPQAHDYNLVNIRLPKKFSALYLQPNLITSTIKHILET